MTEYFIFITDNLTGETIPICNGAHANEDECREHWTIYSYGVCDGWQGCLNEVRGSYSIGSHEYSLRIQNDGRDVEYFMVLDQEGHDLMLKISNEC